MEDEDLKSFEEALAKSLPDTGKALDDGILAFAVRRNKTAKLVCLPLLATAASLFLAFVMWPRHESTSAKTSTPDYSQELNTLDLARWEYRGLSEGGALLFRNDEVRKNTEWKINPKEPFAGHRVISADSQMIVFEIPREGTFALYCVEKKRLTRQ